jgi:hydroxymethylpyrimidine pyrophosphatase-like HAD family hydrolase
MTSFVMISSTFIAALLGVTQGAAGNARASPVQASCLILERSSNSAGVPASSPAPSLLGEKPMLKALACDYDGTLATHDRIGEPARRALTRARERGMRLILVTGRTFFELARVCERLDLFDAVVAENGAVLYLPEPGSIRDEGPPAPARLLAELDRAGVAYQVGRVVVGMARADESRVRQALAACHVSLDLVYNRAALMLLPTGVSKGTGVRHALRLLGLSPHDALALGDAENDLMLFEACGYAGCPENGVPELRARADWIFPGEDGEGLARAIEGPILGGQLPLDRSSRQRIELGWARGTAEPVSLPARGVNVLIHGDPLSGKSWLAGAFVERLVRREYSVCVIDPEGDYRVLAALPGIHREEVRDEAEIQAVLARIEQDPAASVVAEISALPHARKLAVIRAGLERIRTLRARLGRPHWVVLDEAHYILHREGLADEVLGVETKGLCLVTYRPSWLRQAVLRALDVLVQARTTRAEELAFFQGLLAGTPGDGSRVTAVLPDLARGEFVLTRTGPATTPTAVTFAATPRGTPHVRHRTKYVDSPVPEQLRFLFRRGDGSLVATADSLASFQAALSGIDENVLAHHARRHDFSRWVLDVFSDQDLAAQLHKTEARANRGEITDLRVALERLIASRYGRVLGEARASIEAPAGRESRR